jgi:hypothetical protein
MEETVEATNQSNSETPEIPAHLLPLQEMCKLNDWMLQQLQDQEKLVVGKLRHWTRVFNDVQRKLISAKAERVELENRLGKEGFQRLMSSTVDANDFAQLSRAESVPDVTNMDKTLSRGQAKLDLTPNRLVFASWPLDDSFFHIARIIRVDTVLPDWIHVEFEFNQGSTSTYLLTQHHSQLHDPSQLKRGDRILVPIDKIAPRMSEKNLSLVTDEDDPQGHVVPCILDKTPLVIPPLGTVEPFRAIPVQHLSAFRAEIREMIDPDDDRARTVIEERYWIEVKLSEILVDQAWLDKKASH